MSVHKHKNATTYRYDFRYKGIRFSGPTDAKTAVQARKVEARIRAELEAQQTGPRKKLKEMTLREAAGRYWEEAGQYLAGDTVFGQIERLVLGLGPNKLISQISSDDLAKYQARARRERKVKKGDKLVPISNRTVNGEVPERISAIYKRAKLWGVNRGEFVDGYDWSFLKLTLPAPRTRSASRREEVMVLRKLRPDYRPIIRFALITGLRRAGFLLKRSQIHFDDGVLEYTKKSKHTGDKGWLPITKAMRKILEKEIERGGEDCEWVFTFQCRKSGGHHKKGERYPITKTSLRRAVERAVAAAGLKDWRLLHDFRHTSATKALRKTKNLRLVQQQLGHSQISQTSRYAHILMDDLREGMEE